jgi:single-strand DNA-binding protein
MQMNRVEIAGHIVKRPDLRYLPSGTAVANARLGQTYRFQDGAQQWQERTNWHSLSFYGDLSRIALTFDKGENIFVEGTIEQREFTPKDGSKRVVSEVIVRHCHLIAPARPTVGALAAQRADPQSGDLLPDLEKAPNHDEDWPVG